MSNNILSQTEANLSLNDNQHLNNAEPHQFHEKKIIHPYNPSIQRRVIRERMQSLEIINQRFARQFRIGLFNLFHRSPDITVGDIKIETYHEFACNLPTPASLNLIHMLPLSGTALFTFEPTLVYIAVDNLFGGDGRFPTHSENKEFTNTESRIIERMLKLAMRAYQDAWKPIVNLNMEYVRSEIQVKFTNITTSPNDIVITTPFLIEIGNIVGEFSICIPIAMIEPLRERLIPPSFGQEHPKNEIWMRNLITQVKHSELELVAHFVDIPLQISRLLQLQIGDVIPIEKPSYITVNVDDIPVLTGQYGILNDQYALRVEQLINPILNTLDESNTHE